MKVTEMDGKVVRMVVASALTDKVVCARVAAVWSKDMLDHDDPASIVFDLTADHYRNHDVPPGKAITTVAEAWMERRAKDDSAVKMLNIFLGAVRDITDNFERPYESNSSYVLDAAGNYFNVLRGRKLKNEIDRLIRRDDGKGIGDVVANFHRVEMSAGGGIDPFRDDAFVDQVYAQSDEPDVIEYHGAAREFFAGRLRRDALIAFLGPEKVGKSILMMDMAFRAVQQRRRVAYFEVGDLTGPQAGSRFYSRMARLPQPHQSSEWPITLMHPTSIEVMTVDGKAVTQVFHEPREYHEPASASVVKRKCRDFIRSQLRTPNTTMRMDFHVNSTISVKGIESVLASWEHSYDFRPDVVFIDYADVLAPPAGKMEVRDQINTTWKQMRALSQRLHCLVVTATQANAASYGRGTIDRRNFSEDKRKMAHVNGMIGINVTDEDREMDVTRLNWILAREKAYSPRRCLYMAGCRAIMNPCVVSAFPSFKE